MDANAPRHLRALTSLRFAGALVVVLHHLPLALPALAGSLVLARAGYVGVTFFFVLSGFVLAYGWTEASGVRDFYLRRVARIYPVHLLTTGVMVAISWQAGIHWQLLPLNLALIQSWSPNATVYFSFVGAAWSLSCEAFFYACFPALIGLLVRCRRAVVSAVMLMSVAVVSGLAVTAIWPAMGEYLYHFPIFRLVDFVVGVLTCLALKRGWRPPIGQRAAAVLCATVYLAVLCAQSLSGSGVEEMWLYSAVMVLPFALVIVTTADAELTGSESVLCHRSPVALGRWSFALYLVHGVVLAAVHESVRTVEGPAAVVAGAAVVGLSVALSWLVFVLYERPLELAIRHRLSQEAGGLPRSSRAPRRTPRFQTAGPPAESPAP